MAMTSYVCVEQPRLFDELNSCKLELFLRGKAASCNGKSWANQLQPDTIFVLM